MNDKITVYTDGGTYLSNPSNKGAVGVIIFSEGKAPKKFSKLLEGNITNNIAEYTAVLFALQKIKESKNENKEIIINSDSQLVVNQLTGIWQIGEEHLRELFLEIKKLMKNFRSVSFDFIPRECNLLADKLVNKTLHGHKLYKKQNMYFETLKLL